jgi:hypothetical protein
VFERFTESARQVTLDAAVWKAGREVEQSWRDRFSDGQWTTFNDVLARLIADAE